MTDFPVAPVTPELDDFWKIHGSGTAPIVADKGELFVNNYEAYISQKNQINVDTGKPFQSDILDTQAALVKAYDDADQAWAKLHGGLTSFGQTNPTPGIVDGPVAPTTVLATPTPVPPTVTSEPITPVVPVVLTPEQHQVSESIFKRIEEHLASAGHAALAELKKLFGHK